MKREHGSTRSTWVWGIVALFLLAVNVKVAYAHDWYFWHWHTSSPGVGIWNYVTEAEAARFDWDVHTDLSLPRRSTHTDISVFGGNYGATGWWGLASIESSGADWPWHCITIVCRIEHAHARYNSFYGGTPGAGTGSDIRGIFCQEIGHTFGLDHSNTGDCMGKTYFNNSNITGPHNWSDINRKY